MPDALPTWLADAYADPLFLWFVLGGTAVSMGSFLLFALPLTALAHQDPAWARRFRIQDRPPDVARWFWPSVGRWLLNNVALLAVVVALWPLLRPVTFVHLGPWPPVWVVILQLLAFVYLDDALYYGMHRTLHRSRWLYDRVHRLHHRVVRPSAITGHYMHPAEFIATGLLMLVGPLLLGAHVGVVYLWIALRQLEASEGHSGYHIPISPLSWLPGGHGADFHDFHHARFHGNYAGILAWIDARAGTWSRGYAAHVASKQGRLGWPHHGEEGR